MSANKLIESANEILAVVKDNQFASTYADHAGAYFMHEKLPEQTGNESAISSRLFSQPTNLTYSGRGLLKGPSMLDYGCSASRIGNGAFRDDADSQALKAKAHVSMSCEGAKKKIYQWQRSKYINV